MINIKNKILLNGFICFSICSCCINCANFITFYARLMCTFHSTIYCGVTDIK
jgi:hypothetical protein